jgi:hypothetical protein
MRKKTKRVTWRGGDAWGMIMPLEIIIGGQCLLVSRTIAEQIRDELTQVLKKHPATGAKARKEAGV